MDQPHNTAMERCVLGCALLGEESRAIVMSILPDESYFYEPLNREIFRAICDLSATNRPVDSMTLGNLLAERKLLEKIGGLPSLAALTDEVPLVTRADIYARDVYNKAMLRRLIRTAEEIRGLCYEENADTDTVIALAAKKIFDLKQEGQIGTLERLSPIMKRAIDELSQQLREDNNRQRRVLTGYPRLDKFLGGLRNGTLNILAARPGMGKSAFALNIAQHVSLIYGKSVAIFSLEMSKEEIAKRFLASRGSIDAQRFNNVSMMTNQDWDHLTEALSSFYNKNIFIDDLSGSSPAEIMARCRQLKLNNQLDLIIVDYLQLMSLKARNENRQQEISEISRSLKLMAKELDVPVLALSQLSRKVEERDSKRPLLSDLRESGSIEQDADTVLFLYRSSYYKTDQDESTTDPLKADLIIAKNRGGPTGTAYLQWMAQYMLFIEPARQHEPGYAPPAVQDVGPIITESASVNSVMKASDDLSYLEPPPSPSGNYLPSQLTPEEEAGELEYLQQNDRPDDEPIPFDI